ncbi:MAG: PAC2 family protein [Euryarchaeota archaeon]|nr:PAC2 family protein [Euryarchaeota archaeon]
MNPLGDPYSVVVRDVIPGKLENSILIMGFSQYSYLGPLVCDSLSMLLNMRQVGYLDSDDLRITATTYQGFVMPSVRIMLKRLESGDYDSILAISSWVELGVIDPVSKKIDPKSVLAYAHAIVDWIKEKEVDVVFAIDTVPSSVPKDITNVFYVATTREADEIASKLLKLSPFNGMFKGFYGALLNYGYERNVDLVLLLFPRSPEISLSSSVIRALHMIGDITRIEFPEDMLRKIEQDIVNAEETLTRQEKLRVRVEELRDFTLYR